MKGGMASLNPADVDSSYMIKDVVPQNFNPLDRALVGGKRHRRRMMGGSGMGALSPANADSSYMIKDVVPQNFNPLDRALVGGRRRRKMRGGTTSHRSQLMPANVTERALLA
jgi:hypothetical protein